jgi:hypothetical protein
MIWAIIAGTAVTVVSMLCAGVSAIAAWRSARIAAEEKKAKDQAEKELFDARRKSEAPFIYGVKYDDLRQEGTTQSATCFLGNCGKTCRNIKIKSIGLDSDNVSVEFTLRKGDESLFFKPATPVENWYNQIPCIKIAYKIEISFECESGFSYKHIYSIEGTSIKRIDPA